MYLILMNLLISGSVRVYKMGESGREITLQCSCKEPTKMSGSQHYLARIYLQNSLEPEQKACYQADRAAT